MNFKKFPSLLALTIGLELILAPLPSYADANSIMNTANQVLNLGNQAYQTAQGMGGPVGANSAHIQNDMNAFRKQQTPVPDKYFTVTNMQKIPGLMQYLASKNINPLSLNCTTLPTTLSEPNNEVCRNERVNGLSGDPAAQSQEAWLYYQQFLQTDKIYQNFSVRSNVGGQSYGTGCMEDAMEVLKGFYSSRTDRLKTKITEMEKKFSELEILSQSDLKAIRETTAILNGEKSKFGREFKNSNIFQYGDKLEDPACNSMYSKRDIDKKGKSEGLLSLEQKLKEDFNTTPPGSKYSAEAYLKNSADIVSDIENLADKVATQANLNYKDFSGAQSGGYSGFLSQLSSSVNSNTGVHSALNASFFSDLQTKFKQSQKALTSQVDVIKSEFGSKGSNVIRMLNDIDNDSSFEAEVNTLQNEIKSDCLNRSGVNQALSRIYDPNLSKQANKHTADQMRKRTKAILEDTQLSPERKLAELKALEVSVGGRYEMRMESDYEVKELAADGTLKTKKVLASGKVTPTGFFTDIINNCESQFQVNKLNNKLSAKEAIKQLRTLKKDYQQSARTHASDIKKEIVKKMINCDGNAATANSTTVGSCSPAKLDMSSAGFCAKGAQSCATNMKQCSEKVAAITQKFKDDRFIRTNNYNENIEATRKKLVNEFDIELAKTMRAAEDLRIAFGVGFQSPEGIERDVKGDRAYDADFLSNGEDSLQIKDPTVYMKMMNDNIKKLSESIEAQQSKIIGPGGILAKHVSETSKNYEKHVISKIQPLMRACLNAYKSYGKMIEDAKMASDKALGEMGEKSGDFCNVYDDVMVQNRLPACDDALGDVSKSMINAAIKAGNLSTAAEARRMRTEMAYACKGYMNQTDKSGKSTVTAQFVCQKAKGNSTLQTELDSLSGGQKEGGKEGWELVCAAISGLKPFVKLCQETVAGGSTDKPTSSIQDNCPKLESSIVAAYTGNDMDNGYESSSDDIEPPSSIATSSFCPGSNDSNGVTKGNSPANKKDKKKEPNATNS